jgi:hypothetical protein
MLEDLANSRYLMNAYAASSESWENFRRTSQQASLYEVAAALCGAWQTLGEDGDFFASLDDMTTEKMPRHLVAALGGVPTDQEMAPPPLTPDDVRVAEELSAHREVDKLLARELVILTQAGMEPVHAVRLIGDLQDILKRTIEPLKKSQVDQLRMDVPRLAEELCRAQQTLKVFNFEPASELAAGHPPHRRWVRTLRTIGKALGATAGAAGAVGNIIGAVASFGVVSGLGLASVLAGAQGMVAAVGDAVEPE